MNSAVPARRAPLLGHSVVVFAGGIVGTATRLGLDALVPHSDTGFPVSTLGINIVGSLILGYLVAGVWPTAPAWLRAALGPGVLGSFTTFSALVISLVTLTDAGRIGLAMAYLGASLLLGFGAAAAGLALGGYRRRRATVRPGGSQ